MHSSTHIPDDLSADLKLLRQRRGVSHVMSISGLSQSTVYDAISQRGKFKPSVVAHLRWTVMHHSDGNKLPANCEGFDLKCPACHPTRADDELVIRIPRGHLDSDKLMHYQRNLIRCADDLCRDWKIEMALDVAKVAFNLAREEDLTFPQTVSQIETGARISEFARRTGYEPLCLEAFDQYFLPSVRRLREAGRFKKDRLPLTSAVQLVKELVSVQNECFAHIPLTSSWHLRIGWLREAARLCERDQAFASQVAFKSIQRQLILAGIRQGSSEQQSVANSTNEKQALTDTRHHFGIRNLQAIHFFENHNPDGVIHSLSRDYENARIQIFGDDETPPSANEGERSTMLGMALYLGIALWKSRKRRQDDVALEQYLSDSRKIRAMSNHQARCIVTSSMLEAAHGWDSASQYLTQVTVHSPNAELLTRIEDTWALLVDLLPRVE